MTEQSGERPFVLRTGTEGPVDAEDLCMAHGEDPTPANIEKYRKILERDGKAAIEKLLP